jgi:hypothetical protein
MMPGGSAAAFIFAKPGVRSPVELARAIERRTNAERG